MQRLQIHFHKAGLEAAQSLRELPAHPEAGEFSFQHPSQTAQTAHTAHSCLSLHRRQTALPLQINLYKKGKNYKEFKSFDSLIPFSFQEDKV